MRGGLCLQHAHDYRSDALSNKNGKYLLTYSIHQVLVTKKFIYGHVKGKTITNKPNQNILVIIIGRHVIAQKWNAITVRCGRQIWTQHFSERAASSCSAELSGPFSGRIRDESKQRTYINICPRIHYLLVRRILRMTINVFLSKPTAIVQALYDLIMRHLCS